MKGGWIGGSPSTGGVARTYGLGDSLTKRFEGPRPEFSRERLRRVFSYFRPYKKEWLVIFLCIVLTAGLSVLPPICVKAILDRGIAEKNHQLLGLLALAMVAIAVLMGLISVLQQTYSARAGQSILFDFRRELYRHLQKMSLHFYTTTRGGEIVSRINNDVYAVEHVATSTLTSIVSNVLSLVVTSIVVFSMSWRLAVLALLIMPAFYFPSRIVGGMRRGLSKQLQEAQADLLAFLHERLHLSGSVLTKVFNQAEADQNVFLGRSARVKQLNIKNAIVGRWLFMVLSVFAVTGPALIYWYGGLEVLKNELSVGTVVAFAALLGNLYRPMHSLASVYVDIQASLAVFDRIFDYLDRVPEVSDRPNATGLPSTEGHIRFEHVSFQYPTPPAALKEQSSATEKKQSFLLNAVSFEIKPGEKVALVGPSGAGKTTITYLLPRFYDVSDGKITVDGHDVRELTQEGLRTHIGMVTQDTFLFNASIRDNLIYAKPTATQQEIESAAEAAQIHDFIQNLPQGYDTLVGERGFRLSGGEKQRIAIARALLKDAKILILDEATSNLDATSEFLIQRALEHLLRGRSSLIIAHRLSTILNADKILVMDGGRVVASGTHTELLARGGLYAELFQQQFGRVLADDRRELEAR
ncbi:MAG: ABC transporter ATP-binding protein [Polyangiaceae bacterium]|nr:ABC transporter ATP-binding protein [Polyangiaceae bacterium]